MKFLDFLFPKKCLECGRGGKYICSSCLKKVATARLVCPTCKNHSYNGATHRLCKTKNSLSGAYSFYKYEGVVRKAIISIKYKFAYDISKELVDILPSKIFLSGSFLIPVPLHKRRENWRGFNQSSILGKFLAEKAGMFFEERLLLRLENTTPQVKLGRSERLRNIRGKFAVNPTYQPLIKGYQTVVVFDDVWTTGATITEACKVLKKAGAKEVWGLTIAKT